MAELRSLLRGHAPLHSHPEGHFPWRPVELLPGCGPQKQISSCPAASAATAPAQPGTSGGNGMGTQPPAQQQQSHSQQQPPPQRPPLSPRQAQAQRQGTSLRSLEGDVLEWHHPGRGEATFVSFGVSAPLFQPLCCLIFGNYGCLLLLGIHGPVTLARFPVTTAALTMLGIHIVAAVRLSGVPGTACGICCACMHAQVACGGEAASTCQARFSRASACCCF